MQRRDGGLTECEPPLRQTAPYQVRSDSAPHGGFVYDTGYSVSRSHLDKPLCARRNNSTEPRTENTNGSLGFATSHSHFVANILSFSIAIGPYHKSICRHGLLSNIPLQQLAILGSKVEIQKMTPA